ncbi:MAG: class IV adenylate cyclase [Phycisphaerae bacterium]
MALEIEAKLRVASHEPVRQRLRDAGAVFLVSVTERNDIFDRPDGSLRRAGFGLRVRSTTDVQTRETRAWLTVKGPVQPGAVKSREELETGVGDATMTSRLLGTLGFTCVLRYAKRRESWRLNDCRVELDEPPYLGLFVEIEGPDEPAIASVRRQLGLSDATHVPESYVALLVSYCRQHGVDVRTLGDVDAGVR